MVVGIARDMRTKDAFAAVAANTPLLLVRPRDASARAEPLPAETRAYSRYIQTEGWPRPLDATYPPNKGVRPSLTHGSSHGFCRHRGAKRRHRVFLGPGSNRRIGLLAALTSAPFAQQPGTPQPPGTPPHPPPDPTAPPPYEDPPRPIPIPRPDEPPDVIDDPPPNPRRNRNSIPHPRSPA